MPQNTAKPLWIPFAEKHEKMKGKTERWPTYLIIHWTSGEPSQKGTDGIEQGAKNGYTYLFLERSGRLFQGTATNQGGYHVGSAIINSFDCLGVEIACAGKVEAIKDHFVPWFAKNKDGSINFKRCIEASEIIEDKDDTKDDGSFKGFYQKFTREQKKKLYKLALYCVSELDIKVENIRGHDEVASPHGRKNDPGLSVDDNGMVGFRNNVQLLIDLGFRWDDFNN